MYMAGSSISLHLACVGLCEGWGLAHGYLCAEMNLLIPKTIDQEIQGHLRWCLGRSQSLEHRCLAAVLSCGQGHRQGRVSLVASHRALCAPRVLWWAAEAY